VAHALAVADRVVMIARGAVLHEGPPGEVVTAASLRELYGVEVRVVALPDAAGVCVPSLRLDEDREQRRVAHLVGG
jgi:iron complex transport system ATP-binding protein